MQEPKLIALSTLGISAEDLGGEIETDLDLNLRKINGCPSPDRMDPLGRSSSRGRLTPQDISLLSSLSEQAVLCRAATLGS
jgi:hypothetical protein